MQTKKFYKWFWPWQDEQEEIWLGEMARQGWHLITPGLLGRYTFAAGEKREVVYRLDFVSDYKKDESYLQLFQDAGWEHVGVLGGWQYFRKEVEPGEKPEIYTDHESKIAKYQRLLLYLVVFLPLFTSVLVTTRDPNPSPLRIWANLIMLILILVYIFVVIGILWRINQLKKS